MRFHRKRPLEIDDEKEPEKAPATQDDLNFLASKKKKLTPEDEKLTTKTGKLHVQSYLKIDEMARCVIVRNNRNLLKKIFNCMLKGGAYIPPARLRAMQATITDKTSEQFQRIAWEALKKSINGLVNKVNVSNIVNIVRELFQENIVRGRYVYCNRLRTQICLTPPTLTR